MKMMIRTVLLGYVMTSVLVGQEVVKIWPGFAPGETTQNRGEDAPMKLKNNGSLHRVTKVTDPTMTVFLPEKGKATGTAVVILPGGGFTYVVPGIEGAKAAKFFNKVGVTAFVLNYRTNRNFKSPTRWMQALQDSQRAVRYVRTHWERFGIDPKKVGIMGFSAGGHVGAIHMGDVGVMYDQVDGVDFQSARPDFAMLIYPWKVWDEKADRLIPAVKLSATAPPAFIVHTDDDPATSLSAVGIYSQLKKSKVSAELHIYQSGGHGYGVGSRKNSAIGTWSSRAVEWLKIRGL